MPIDLRFYDSKGPQKLRALLTAAGLSAQTDQDPDILGLAAASDARPGDMCFVEGDAKQAAGVSPAAAACFVSDAAG